MTTHFLVTTHPALQGRSGRTPSSWTQPTGDLVLSGDGLFGAADHNAATIDALVDSDRPRLAHSQRQEGQDSRGDEAEPKQDGTHSNSPLEQTHRAMLKDNVAAEHCSDSVVFNCVVTHFV
ncbi:hypothetical protein [Nocardia sp. CA-120079]|uniref:hypothetical protein n=1 Tax=Nocardia sp. CA-120079 TaxID=3239974 RepID=UPI003D9602F9